MTIPALQVKNYVLEEPLGEGAGGTFFRAYQPAENGGRGRRDLFYRANRSIAHDVNAADLLRANLEKGLGVTHSGLLSPITCSISPEELVVVSEWVPGVSLADLNQHLSDQNKKWPVPLALYLTSEIAKVLCFLQSAVDPILGRPLGLVHGQVRPENIFISFGGQIKIIGLGMATLETFALQSRGGFLEHRANYASPEQASGRELDGRSDLFSLGVILWELLVGRALFPACSREESVRILSEKAPPPPSQTREEVPKELDTVLGKLLDRDRHLRYELGEKATRDMSAVLTFRFPEFIPLNFSSFCKENLAEPFEKFQKSIAQESRAADETKVIVAPASGASTSTVAERPAAAAPATAPAISRETILLDVSRPAPARIIVSDGPVLSSPQQAYLPMKAALALCAVSLITLPFVLPRYLGHTKDKREIARQKALKAREKFATLHFTSPDTDYQVKVNGQPVDVNDGRAVVLANQELNVVAQKAGYEEVQVDTQLMPDEEFNIPLSFTKLPSPTD